MSEYIKSPLNYIGGKYKLLPQIIPLFPDKINTFVDLFGGSGTVSLNTQAEHYVYNDINHYVSSILSGIKSSDTHIVGEIENIISDNKLYTEDGFKKFREWYNQSPNNWKALYALTCHSFNWQIRFNSKHQYNSSFGKERSSFTKRMKDDLLRCVDRLNDMDIVFMSLPFDEFDFSDFTTEDFVYCDPPYFNSIGNYNDGKRGFEGWSKEHELKLYNLLDKLDKQGIRFALSNNLKCDNDVLNKWCRKYKIIHLDKSYSNCNYHKKDKNTADVEVLITNY